MSQVESTGVVAVLSVALGVRDLANIRFAVSPLWEAVATVRVVKHPDSFPVHLPWYRQIRPGLAAVDWRLFADRVPVPTVVIEMRSAQTLRLSAWA